MAEYQARSISNHSTFNICEMLSLLCLVYITTHEGISTLHGKYYQIQKIIKLLMEEWLIISYPSFPVKSLCGRVKLNGISTGLEAVSNGRSLRR